MSQSDQAGSKRPNNRGWNNRGGRGRNFKNFKSNNRHNWEPKEGQNERNFESLADSLKGFLITCNANEYQCLMDAYNILNEAADSLYGPFNEASDEGDNSANPDDIDAAIEKEVKNLKTHKKRRFVQVKTKCKDQIFVKCNDDKVDVNALADKIFSQIKETKQQVTRHIQRILPVVKTFKADVDRFESKLKDVFAESTTESMKTYACMAKVSYYFECSKY